MTLLTGGAGVGLLGEGVDEWQVFRFNGEGCPLDEMTEVSDSSMDGEQLPVEGGVARFGRRELPTEEGKRLSGTVEDLLEDGTDGNVTRVGGENEGKTRCRKFKVGGVGEGPFCVVEGCSLQRTPVKGLGLPSEGGVQMSHGGGDVRQESTVVVDHANEVLQGLHSVGCRKGTNNNFFLQGEDALGRDMTAQEIDLFGPKDTFVVAEDKASREETFKDQVKVMPVLFRIGEEDEDVIEVGDSEGKIAKDGVSHPLKDGTSVAKTKTGVVECVGAGGHGNGSLWDVVGMHGDLVVTLQEVQF